MQLAHLMHGPREGGSAAQHVTVLADSNERLIRMVIKDSIWQSNGFIPSNSSCIEDSFWGIFHSFEFFVNMRFFKSGVKPSNLDKRLRVGTAYPAAGSYM